MRGLNLLTALFVVVTIAGCSSTIVYEFDKDGKVVRKTETSTDIVGSIAQSTKDKTLVIWRNGWAGYLSVSPGTQEDPSPHGKIFVGKTDGGYISIHKDHQKLDFEGVAEVIRSTNSDLAISADAKKLTLTAQENKEAGK